MGKADKVDRILLLDGWTLYAEEPYRFLASNAQGELRVGGRTGETGTIVMHHSVGAYSEIAWYDLDDETYTGGIGYGDSEQLFYIYIMGPHEGMAFSVAEDTGRCATRTKPPANASATGHTGEFTWDATHFYVCVAENTWKRVAIATW